MTVSELLRDALEELGVIAAGESLSSANADYALRKLHRMLDNWNAEGSAVYVDLPAEYTLTPSLNPHTIGPSGATFTVTQRPERILSANLKYAGSDVRTPINADRDVEWYQALPTPEIESAVPTDLYYAPTWPNGSIYLWPVPSTAHTLEILTRIVLSQPALTDTFTMPPGYQDAVTLSLAESMLGAFPVSAPPTLKDDAREARARVWRKNDRPRRISTIDVGMPGRRSHHFNYLNGQ